VDLKDQGWPGTKTDFLDGGNQWAFQSSENKEKRVAMLSNPILFLDFSKLFSNVVNEKTENLETKWVENPVFFF